MEDLEHRPKWVVDGEEQPIGGAISEEGGWCWDCVMEVRSGRYKRWFKGIKEADCAAALRRAIGKGPPMTLADAIDGLRQPTPPDYGEMVCEGHEPVSGKLVGSFPTEASRQNYWNELKDALAQFEAVEAAEKEEK